MVVDSARAIVDGHIILSRTLAEQGVYPAIDVARSLSRTMADSVDPDHAAAAARFRQLWSAYEENRDLMLMGAYIAGSDPILDEAIALRSHQLAFVSQPAAAQVDFENSRHALIEGYSA
jgi:flagellum-specific ATP synthase